MRFWEIDFFRGMAIVLMLIFNWSFTLAYFRIYAIDGGWLYWFLFPRLIASMFILIAGVSFSVSYSKIKSSHWTNYSKYFGRGLLLFSIGMGITFVTYVLTPQGTIYFGILHLIGASLIIAPFFRRLGKLIPVAGLGIILLGMIIQPLTVNYPWLLWLGLLPQNFYTFDYFPLLPWFGLFLVGMHFGNKLYRNGKRTFKIAAAPGASGYLRFLGRYSLAIYILHQPVLIALLYLIGYKIF